MDRYFSVLANVTGNNIQRCFIDRTEKHTTKFLVLAGKSVLLFASLVELVADALDLSDLDAEIALSLFVELDGLLKPGLDLNVDALKLLGSLLELPSCAVGLLQVDDENFDLQIKKKQ